MQTQTEELTIRYDRVRAHTDTAVNRRIDDRTIRELMLYAQAERDLIARRLDEIETEWDIERTLELNASAVALTGVALGAFVNRRWLLLPAAVAIFLMQHAVQGWCPPLPIFRRLGVRTRKEIDRERSALKLLRGDFDGFHSGEKPDVPKILEIVDR